MKRRAPTRLGTKAVAALAFQFSRDRHPITLREIELPIHNDFIPAGKKPHLFHCRLNADSVGCGFTWIDIVREFDSDSRLFENMIKSGDPFDFERRGFSHGKYLQIRQRFATFRVEQAINDQIVRPTSGQRLRVYLNPATGERRYYADQAAPSA